MACLFGSAHKQPWRTKSKQKHPIWKLTDDALGKQDSLDQMVSAQPGLIPQMSGHLTNLGFTGATVFVDHFSDHVYVYLMGDLTLEGTLLAKHAYECFLAALGVDSRAYHANNGRFADKGFQDDCVSCNQKGSTICPTSEIVCLPVLIFTYSHVENALIFALDLVVFLQLELLFQTYQLVYYNLYIFSRLLLKSPSLFSSLILLNNILIEKVS